MVWILWRWWFYVLGCPADCQPDPAYNDCNGVHMGDATYDECGNCDNDSSNDCYLATEEYFNTATQTFGLHNHLNIWLDGSSPHGLDSDGNTLDSNGSEIMSTWIDLSGNGNHLNNFEDDVVTWTSDSFKNTISEQSGSPIVKLNDARMWNNNASFDISDKVTIYYVIERSDLIDPWNSTIFYIGEDGAGEDKSSIGHYNYGNGQGDNTSSWDMLLDEKVALWKAPGQNWDAYYTVAANSAQASQPNLYKLEFDDGTISLFRDGQMITTKTGANLSDYNFDNSFITIGDNGSNYDGSIGHLDKRIDLNFAEMMVFNTVLTEEEDESISQYLLDKWGFLDCAGVPNGNSTLDACGICDGGNVCTESSASSFNYEYIGEGECRDADGSYSLEFAVQTGLSDFYPWSDGNNAELATEFCQDLCSQYSEWCVATTVLLKDNSDWPGCHLHTDFDLFTNAGFSHPEDWNEWGYQQVIDGNTYTTYCNGSGSNCENTVWGGGSLSPRDGYHCYIQGESDSESECTFVEGSDAGCDGVCFSEDTLDECGVCAGDNSTCTDECGVINGDNSTCADCAGIPNGDAQMIEYWVDSDGDGLGAGVELVSMETMFAFYPFNGNVNDESGNGNHCYIENNVVLSEDANGNANSAYYFDGSDSRIVCPEEIALGNSSFTISLMAKSGTYETGENFNRTLFSHGYPQNWWGTLNIYS